MYGCDTGRNQAVLGGDDMKICPLIKTGCLKEECIFYQLPIIGSIEKREGKCRFLR